MQVFFRRLSTWLVLALAVMSMPAAAEEITVFAAASLTNALNEVGQAFEQKEKHTVRFSFASSSTLAKQIENGAPAHLFLSADLDWMDYLAPTRPDRRWKPCRFARQPASADRPRRQSPKSRHQARRRPAGIAVGRAIGNRATRTMCRPANTPGRPLRSWGPGKASRAGSPEPTTCALLWRWWSAPSARSELSMPPMRQPPKK